MAVYSLGQRATGFTNGTALWELRTAAAARARLHVVSLSASIATSGPRFGLGRPAAIGVTPTSPQTWLAHDPGDPAGTVQGALAWGTGPTAPARFFAQHLLFNQYMLFWTFPVPLVIGVSSSIVVWNSTGGTSTVVDMFTRGDE